MTNIYPKYRRVFRLHQICHSNSLCSY